jgi:hypothetical protein
VKEVHGGHPEDSREGGPSILDAEAQANEDHARHLWNRNQGGEMC